MVIQTNNIFCNQISAPEFTAEQIAKCKGCKFASGKGNWCGHFGVWIREKKIIQPGFALPDKRLRVPNRPSVSDADYQKYLNSPARFRQTYSVLLDICKKEGITNIVDEKTYGERRQLCWKCPPEEKSNCNCVGCKNQKKLMDKNLKCPKGKW